MRAWKKVGVVLALAAGVVVGGTAEAMTLDEEQQLDVLSAQNQIWEQNMSIEEAVAQDGKFAVTDLDHNGRMEILFTTTIGEEEFVIMPQLLRYGDRWYISTMNSILSIVCNVPLQNCALCKLSAVK